MPPNQLVKDVRAAMERETDINLHRFPIQLSYDEQEDALLMAGTVEDIVALRKAQQLARQLCNGRVIDTLQVQQSTDRSNDELQDAVLRTLSSEPAFRDISVGEAKHGTPSSGDSRNMVVSVSGSCVHLEGTLNSLTHRRLAEILVWWVPGTARVENRIHVQPPEEDSDAELTEAVRIVLEKDPLLDAGQIQVRTRDHEVTLDGGVRSEANRTLASRDCWYIPGVHAVHNYLHVVH